MKGLWSTFCESDGSGSFARVIGGLAAVVALVWGSFIVRNAIQHNVSPDLKSVMDFILALLSPYVANKALTIGGETAKAIWGQKGAADGQP